MPSPPITPIASSSSTTGNANPEAAPLSRLNTPVLTAAHFNDLKANAFELGFDCLALTTPIIPSEDQAAYESWVASGYAAEMSYMDAAPSRRLHPEHTFPGVRSILTLGVSYHQGALPPKPGPSFGRVARYAWGMDYHSALLQRLESLAATINRIVLGAACASVAVDTKPLLERALARQAGMGFVGKNTVFIVTQDKTEIFSHSHLGSFIFLGEILLQIDVEPMLADASSRRALGCGACARCLTACPTGAFEKPYTLDARRCVAYLTIEHKEGIPRPLREKMGDWLFGCDVCQDICPHNARSGQTRWKEFLPESGAGPWVSLSDALRIQTPAEFEAKWGQTPFKRAKRKGLLRNACVAAGNSADPSLVSRLEPLLDEADGVLRSHALWALSRLWSPSKMRAAVSSHIKKETDAAVLEEGRLILEG